MCVSVVIIINVIVVCCRCDDQVVRVCVFVGGMGRDGGMGCPVFVGWLELEGFQS